MNRTTYLLLLITGVLLADQILKIWVKTNMEIGEEFLMLGQSWARIHFVENEGMAFGWKIPATYGKLILSLFRLAAIGFLVYLIRNLMRAGAGLGLLTCFGLIFAGALGNIIDSAFYGIIFSSSPYHGGVATMFPAEGGYAGLLHGKVVDMFYFPLIETRWPEWMPFVGGDAFLFFRPVFNIADAAITCGVFMLLLFHRNFFTETPAGESPVKPRSTELEGETTETEAR